MGHSKNNEANVLQNGPKIIYLWYIYKIMLKCIRDILFLGHFVTHLPHYFCNDMTPSFYAVLLILPPRLPDDLQIFALLEDPYTQHTEIIWMKWHTIWFMTCMHWATVLDKMSRAGWGVLYSTLLCKLTYIKHRQTDWYKQQHSCNTSTTSQPQVFWHALTISVWWSGTHKTAFLVQLRHPENSDSIVWLMKVRF